jgi:hypothetical protein
MTTRFEQIAAAFPLHCQRIAEATYDEGGIGPLLTLQRAAPIGNAGETLADLFYWCDTSEGHLYWRALAMGAGWTI